MTGKNQEMRTYLEMSRDYIRGCFDKEKSRVYGTLQERAAFNITQFPKVQGSLLNRMGLAYPILSQLVEYAGIPKDASSDFCGMTINYHTWAAGYLAYLAEVQIGMSKYPIEFVSKTMEAVKKCVRDSIW